MWDRVSVVSSLEILLLPSTSTTRRYSLGNGDFIICSWWLLWSCMLQSNCFQKIHNFYLWNMYYLEQHNIQKHEISNNNRNSRNGRSQWKPKWHVCRLRIVFITKVIILYMLSKVFYIITGYFTPMRELVAARRQRRQAASLIKQSAVTLKPLGEAIVIHSVNFLLVRALPRCDLGRALQCILLKNSKWNKDVSFLRFPRDTKRWENFIL